MMLAFTFRHASQKDVQALTGLEREAFSAATYSPEYLLEEEDFSETIADVDYHVIIAETLSGEVAGYCVIDCARQDMSAANIDSLAIAPKFNAQGLGLALLQEAEHIARTESFPAVSFETFLQGRRALKRGGYCCLGQNSEGQYLYQKDLSR